MIRRLFALLAVLAALCIAIAGCRSNPFASSDACASEDGDDACTTCRKAACCEELRECMGNTRCECFMRCVSGWGLGGDPTVECMSQCRSATKHHAITACQANHCGNVCPFRKEGAP
jgi:hypothetical protein